MKITHVITTIERGGAENAVASLARAQVINGYSVTVIPLKGKLELLDSLKSCGVNVDTRIHGRTVLYQIFRLRQIIPFDSFVHAHLPRAELVSRLSFFSQTFFVTRHNSEAFWPQGSLFVSKLLSHFVTQKATAIIAISRAVKTFLLESGEISPSSNCVVIHYGFEVENRQEVFHGQSTVKPKDGFSLVTIGRLEPQKNTTLLLRMMQVLKQLNPNYHLSIVGDGRQRKMLELKAKNLGVSGNVTFLGRRANVFTHLESADLFVLASNYEGFGLVLLEAMEAGLPIIAPNNSSIPEVLGLNHPGLYETDNLNQLISKILEFRNNQDLISAVLASQQLRLKSFNMARYFETHNILYKSS